MSCPLLESPLCSSCPLITLLVEQLSVVIHCAVVDFLQQLAAEFSLFQILTVEVCLHACHTSWDVVTAVDQDKTCCPALHIFKNC